ncbi:hypothetical protein [Catellatospora chokoriensis]|uniref:Peptidase M1 membrane alanine aminopeptidase domain-containing protein n=1 Tax=Catellatospora chokoriensis TaxID=310353 RepID=A0A8J3KCA6_9ACTN|nr:hypothetical protein [Catellatospora chokoriensis]GIF94143.1 hypothetical protein Cch02nite_75870 [Catellatospora chokoriensis]
MGVTIRTPAAADTAPDFKAAVAEALHLAGRFDEAAAEFTSLAQAGHRTGVSALKAAISRLAAGDTRCGTRLLDVARTAGAPPYDVSYVRAQALWHAGSVDRALSLMAQAAQEEPSPGRAANALGMLLCRTGHREDGLALVRKAADASPPDPCALVNLVVAGPRIPVREAQELLNRAAALAPQRPDAHRVWSVLAAREQLADEVELARQRSALRATPSRHATTGAARPEPQYWADGRVELAIGRGVRLAAVITLDDQVWAAHRPSVLRINEGYGRVQVGDQEAAAGSITLDDSCWDLLDGARRLRIQASGTPSGPCTRFDARRVELGEASWWLPTFEPGPDIRWTPVAVPDEGAVDIPLSGDRRGGLGWCRLRHPETFSLPAGASAVGHAHRSALRTLATTATAYTDLLTSLLGREPPRHPRVVLVDAPSSTFCYTRAGVIRVASGAVDRGIAEVLLGHEVGHLWWGIRAPFAPAGTWLCEALAEYTLHLADRSGMLAGGYRRKTLEAVARLDAAGSEAALETLARRTDPAGRHLLRAKGGFVIAMLENIVGADVMTEALRHFLRLGRTHVLDTFAFAAIVGAAYGGSVDWVLQQWLERPGLLDIRLDPIRLTGSGAGWELAVQARCTTPAVPGSAVTIEVTDVHGARERQRVLLDVAPAVAVFSLRARPAVVVADPDHLLFRTLRPATVLGRELEDAS